jgi:hypothetical protein
MKASLLRRRKMARGVLVLDGSLPGFPSSHPAGKRKVRRIDATSTEAEQVYECDLCAWLLRVPADVNCTDIQATIRSARPVRLLIIYSRTG